MQQGGGKPPPIKRANCAWSASLKGWAPLASVSCSGCIRHGDHGRPACSATWPAAMATAMPDGAKSQAICTGTRSRDNK
ncbi:hypothetical protein JOS77_16470 [Chromobacterium haemolyticum]|nr:hypothetical protein JOS77_16470 [Chromobacterium haemolyticum]